MAFETAGKHELEEQYSPSKWSQRGTSEEVLKAHVNFVEKASQETRRTISGEFDIKIGNGSRQQIDVFGADLPKDAPWFVYFHGGYWQELSREISSYPVTPLVKAGVRVAIPGYDLCPDVNLNEIVSQANAAALFCLKRAQSMGAKSITFCGHSAGAHLVAMIISEDSISSLPDHLQDMITGVCLISGVFDIAPLQHTTINDKLKLTDDEVLILSPMLQSYRTFKTKKNIKTLIAVGQYDSDAFKTQSKEFSRILSSCFNNVIYKEMTEYDHFNIVEKLYYDDYTLLRIIIEQLIVFDRSM